MGTHSYTNAGAAPEVSVSRRGPLATVYLRDGGDTVELTYTDLDTLRYVTAAFIEARTKFVDALLDTQGEMVPVRDLEQGDEALIDGDLVSVDTVMVDGARVVVRHLDHESDSHSTIFVLDAQVRRVMAPALSAVR